MMLIRVFKIFVFVILLGAIGGAHADHPGPERVVEDKYVVIFSVVPIKDNSVYLRFFFNDARSGARISDITASVSITGEEGKTILSGRTLDIANGASSLEYEFPYSGLFDIYLEFSRNGEAEIYKPDKWSVRVGMSPSMSLSEFIAIGILGTAIILVCSSYLYNKRKK